MGLARCIHCRGTLSSETSPCPYCGAKDPIDLARDEGWASNRDPMRLDPDASGPPFRFLLGATVLFILVAVLLAFCASATPAPDGA